MKKYNYIDLFSGAGGFTLGFDKAGFKNLFAVEFNKEFANTYQKNFNKHNVIIDDIKNIDEGTIKRYINGKQVDVVIGGPPCQGFSLAGNNARKFIDDDRNTLFREFIRMVSIIKPKIFIMENVSAMARHNKGKTIEEILLEFKEIGYNTQFKIINTVNYGIPQERRRIFIVGTLKENRFTFPKEEDDIISIKKAIHNLPKLESGEIINSIPNHVAMKHSKQMLDKMNYIPDGGNRESIPIELRPKSGDSRKYIRYNSEKPSVCITGDMRKIFHYDQNRALTIRELARVQTFPDDFVFYGTSGSMQQQIGNAVPPILAEKIANNVKEFLEKYE